MNLQDIHNDFILSREAMYASKNTIKLYEKLLNRFYRYQGDESISTQSINRFLSYLREEKHNGKPLSDKYIHCHARVIKTLTRFMLEEGYIEKPIKITMPKIAKKKLLVLDSQQEGWTNQR